jgi:hypothetical protein
MVIALVLGLAPFWLSPAMAQRDVVERDFSSEREWRCTRCNNVLDYGPAAPAIDQCPHCGARLLNARSGEPESSEPSAPASSPAILPEIKLSPPVLAGIGVTSVIVIVFGLFQLLNRGKDQVPIDDPSAPQS